MATKFNGTLEELKARIQAAGIQGTWSEEGQKISFVSRAKGVLNWWPHKGTIQFQGKPQAKLPLESLLADGEGVAPSVEGVVKQASKRQIFIVHGHDTTARDQLELALHRLGLEPYVLMNRSGGGMTLIEALEGKIGRDYSSDFGIVLMTPDDMGYSKSDGAGKAEPRARQNVVLEAGMLLASLTRSRTAFVVKGHVELPSDLQGIIRLGYNDHVKEVVPKLCQRLKEVGFDLRTEQIAEAAQ